MKEGDFIKYKGARFKIKKVWHTLVTCYLVDEYGNILKERITDTLDDGGLRIFSKKEIDTYAFWESIFNRNDLLRFDIVHEKIVFYIESDLISDLKSLINSLKHFPIDSGISRTVLISLKPIIHKEEYKELNICYLELRENYENRKFVIQLNETKSN